MGLQNSGLHRLGRADAGLGIALRHATVQAEHGVVAAAAATDGYALALKLAATVMVAGAVLVAAAFEKVGFMAPDQQPLDAAEASAGQDDEAA